MKTRVVVADDLPDLRFLLAALLSADARFEIAGEAGDGRAAVEVVASAKPDVAILDLMMPRMGGLEAAAQIATASPHTKVVLYSALVGEKTQEEMPRSNIVEFVPKGARARVIVEAVARAAGA